MLLQEVTYKKTETVKGSTPASYKEESKTTGEWKVTVKEEVRPGQNPSHGFTHP
jgi:hypothetical protein